METDKIMKTIQMAVVIAGLSFSAFTLEAQIPPFLTNGLVAYFPFNGNANDASGNLNNGTMFGSAAFGVDRFGNSNSCLSLPGTSGNGSGVDIPSLSSMSFSPVTYSAWIRINNYLPNSLVMTLVGREQCGDTQEGAICIFSEPSYTNQLAYYTGAHGIAAELVPPTNRWGQVVLTIDQTGNGNLYFNGTNVLATGITPTSGQPLDFRIGASASGGCGEAGRYVWNGLIDDVRIYNVAFSSNEVQQLYAYESVPEACIPYPATATATETNGFVVAINVTDSGCGYTNTPPVFIVGGGGAGATATAVVTNGSVVAITITDAGIGYTNTPAVYIYTPLAITAQPQSVLVNAHGSASFSVAASGNTPLSYQWSLNSTNIPGATSNSLAISNVVQTNLGTYAVVVTNYFGKVTSTNATLSMYPFLATPFGGLDTYWGYTNLLSVQAWGSGPLSFQWYQNGVALAGATNSTVDFAGIQLSNAGLYSVVVTSPFGSVTNTPEQVVVNPGGVYFGGIYPSVIIQGVVGYHYIIQSTSNLSNTNAWVTLTNLMLSQPVQLWVDTNTDASLPGNPQRFYQVLPGQ